MTLALALIQDRTQDLRAQATRDSQAKAARAGSRARRRTSRHAR